MELKYSKVSLSYEFFKKSIIFLIELKLFGALKVCFSKNSVINKFFFNQYIFVYQGKFFLNIFIYVFMLGYRIGSFLCTKKLNLHISFKKIRSSKR